MTNLYDKVAVASVCTALSFVMGASEEVKAVTITVPPTIQFGVQRRFHPLGDTSPKLTSESDRVTLAITQSGGSDQRLAEFNISSFFRLLIQLLRVLFFRISFPGSYSTVSMSLLVWVS
jgi:hypothetical protein